MRVEIHEIGLWLKEIGPTQLELGSVAPCRLRPGDLRSRQFEVFECRNVPYQHPGFHFGIREGRPEGMHGSWAELRCAEFAVTPGIEVKLNGIAIPDLIVGANMDWLLIQATQADVEVLLVPQVEELRPTVGEIRMANMDRRDKGT